MSTLLVRVNNWLKNEVCFYAPRSSRPCRGHPVIGGGGTQCNLRGLWHWKGGSTAGGISRTSAAIGETLADLDYFASNMMTVPQQSRHEQMRSVRRRISEKGNPASSHSLQVLL